MKFANAAKLHRKSGGAEGPAVRPSLTQLPINFHPAPLCHPDRSDLLFHFRGTSECASHDTGRNGADFVSGVST
jgi:hypothetical protein